MRNKHALGFVRVFAGGVFCAFILIASVGCTAVIVPVTPQGQDGQATTVAPQTPTPTPQLSLDDSALITQEETVNVDVNAPNPQVLQAMKDLAERTSTALGEVEVVNFEIVVWPDGGLGCPRPGMVYPQVQQDGMLIHLRANGVTYEYHSGEGRPPFLCENSTPAKRASPNLTPELPDSSK